jgi:hypothetical protein
MKRMRYSPILVLAVLALVVRYVVERTKGANNV